MTKWSTSKTAIGSLCQSWTESSCEMAALSDLGPADPSTFRVLDGQREYALSMG